MSSLFDSEVYIRRRATPFTEVNLTHLLAHLAVESPDGAVVNGQEVTLTVHYRGDVASRLWWTLKWWDVEGEHVMCAQEFDLLLWRVATIVGQQEQREKEKRRIESTS
jgi:hypothetical protein